MSNRLLFLLLFTSSVVFADTASDLAALEALGTLTTAPTVYGVDTSSGVSESSTTVEALSAGDHKTIFFDSIDYQGNPTKVYAWIDIPAGVSAVNQAPAIVLVHGGGGRAFEDWVELWSARGYVAISIDTEGNSTNSAGDKVHHALGGPPRTGVYNESATAIEDQFMYHATAATVLANSLLRSLPFVDASKVGVHGVSWGGVITSTVIGLDDRFAFAIPSYGCGHMYDAVGNWGDFLKDNDQYKTAWDPFLRLDRATLPIMWLSWPTDSPFNVDSQAHCSSKSPGTEMVTLIPGMLHGHGATWHRADPYDFADSIVNTGSAWCTQQSLSLVGDQIEVVFASTRTLTGATLIYTNETGETTNMTWPELSVDSFTETASGVWTVTATLPADANGWFINVTAASTVSGYPKGDVVYVSTQLQEVVDIQQPTLIELGLKDGNDSATGNVGVDFSAIHNLDVTEIDFINESHAGAFSHSESFPFILLPNAPFEVAFDNTVAGLAVGENATATLRITWLGLDNVSNTIDVPLQATVYTPQVLTYNATADWSSQSPTIADHVIIRDGAEVALDVTTEISNLTVGQDATLGYLAMDQAYDLTITDGLNITAGSRVTIASGVLDYSNTTLDIDGEIHVAGGSFNLNGTTVQGSGKLKVTSGELIFAAAKTIDIAEIEISGGTLNFTGGGSSVQTFLGDNGVNTLTIIGSIPVVSVGILNLQPWTATSPVIDFELDAAGVSPVQVTSFMNLPQLTIHVDAATYAGGVGEITLLEAGNFATLGDTANYYATGFAAKGLSAEFVQDQVTDVVKLVLTKNAYGTWADAKTLAPADYHASMDPDFDGLTNLMEFVLGSDPSVSEPRSVPVVPIAPDSLVFSFSRNAAASAETTQIFQYSSDLVGWTDVVIDATDPDITITTTSGGMEDVEILISPSAPVDGRLFGRVAVDFVE